MKPALALLALTIACSALGQTADILYRAAYVSAIGCHSRAGIVRLANIKPSDEYKKLLKRGGCGLVNMDWDLRILGTETIQANEGPRVIAKVSTTDRIFYVNRGALEELSSERKAQENADRAASEAASRCDAPGAMSAGEVRRLETGPDGQLYLKRYWLYSKCVNGRVKGYSKPLN